MRPRTGALLGSIGLATAIHFDWHLARPNMGDGMSGEWALHWLAAIPVFALLAWYLSKGPAGTRWRRSALVIGIGVVLGQLLEPLYELLTDAPMSWAFGRIRWSAYGEFMGAGMVTFLAVMAMREPGSRGAREPGD